MAGWGAAAKRLGSVRSKSARASQHLTQSSRFGQNFCASHAAQSLMNP
jgi:hypothetical protein